MSKATLCRETPEAIVRLCESRNLRCKGFPYSIRKLMPDYNGLASCIFADTPISWDPDKDN